MTSHEYSNHVRRIMRPHCAHSASMPPHMSRSACWASSPAPPRPVPAGPQSAVSTHTDGGVASRRRTLRVGRLVTHVLEFLQLVEVALQGRQLGSERQHALVEGRQHHGLAGGAVHERHARSERVGQQRATGNAQPVAVVHH